MATDRAVTASPFILSDGCFKARSTHRFPTTTNTTTTTTTMNSLIADVSNLRNELASVQRTVTDRIAAADAELPLRVEGMFQRLAAGFAPPAVPAAAPAPASAELEKQVAALLPRIASLEQQQRTSSSSTASLSAIADRTARLDQTVSGLDGKITKAVDAMEARVQRLWERVSGLEATLAKVAKDLEALKKST
jgi:flagellar capping protein FliD